MSIEEARHRVHAAIDILSTYVPAELVRGAKVLDIGCGTGNGVIAALTLGARCAIGIDRDAHEFGETFFQPLAREFGVDQSSALLIEADIFKLKFFDEGFDLAIMYDAIEHVPDPETFVDIMAASLRPGGVGLIQTCPLYYGAVGHHLWNEFPEASEPWVHLYFDFEERLARANVGEWGLQRFRELNKVTRGELLAYLADAGLKV